MTSTPKFIHWMGLLQGLSQQKEVLVQALHDNGIEVPFQESVVSELLTPHSVTCIIGRSGASPPSRYAGGDFYVSICGQENVPFGPRGLPHYEQM